MQAYREAPPAPANSTLDYFPHGPRGRFVYVAAFCFVALFAFWLMTYLGLTEIRVHCTRAEAACSIRTTRPISGSTSISIPLSQIDDVAPRLSSGRNPDYQVVLYLKHGDEDLGGHWSATGAQQIVDALQDFFETSDEPEIDILTNPSRSGVAAIYAIAGVGSLAFGCSFLQTARIEVIWRQRVFRVIRNRWPLPSHTEDFPLDDVRGAYVTEAGSKRRPFFGVLLRVEGEVDIRLPGDRTPLDEPKRRFVKELEQLLHLRDAGGPMDQAHGEAPAARS